MRNVLGSLPSRGGQSPEHWNRPKTKFSPMLVPSERDFMYKYWPMHQEWLETHRRGEIQYHRLQQSRKCPCSSLHAHHIMPDHHASLRDVLGMEYGRCARSQSLRTTSEPQDKYAMWWMRYPIWEMASRLLYSHAHFSSSTGCVPGPLESVRTGQVATGRDKCTYY